MARRRRASKMVVEAEKTSRAKAFGFGTDQFSIETNKTLLEHKTMTFSTVVARQLGYVTGVMSLTLVWQGKRITVRFVRDSHPGGGWRSVKEDFIRFFDEVGFRKNQGYNVYQVPGLGQYAFEFELSWEHFPNGGTMTIPLMRREYHFPDEDRDLGGALEAGGSSGARTVAEKMPWRRAVAAKKSAGSSVGSLKKKKPRMRVGALVKIKRREDAEVGPEKRTAVVQKPRKKQKMIYGQAGSGDEPGIGKASEVPAVKEEPYEAKNR